MRFQIVPYNTNSASARLLRETLRRKGHQAVFVTENSPRVRDALNDNRDLSGYNFIQWGASILNDTLPSATIKTQNRFYGFGVGHHLTNKATFFRTFGRMSHGIINYLPPFFATVDSALTYMRGVGDNRGSQYPGLVERQTVTGTNGEGILFLKAGEAPTNRGRLWVCYKKKTKEFRVHVVNGVIIHAQVKKIPAETMARTNAADRIDRFTLRNFDNGWRFTSIPLTELPRNVITAAETFIAANIYFSRDSANIYALDIVFNERDGGSAYILEANRAPGLSEVTVEKYADYFISNGV